MGFEIVWIATLPSSQDDPREWGVMIWKQSRRARPHSAWGKFRHGTRCWRFVVVVVSCVFFHFRRGAANQQGLKLWPAPPISTRDVDREMVGCGCGLLAVLVAQLKAGGLRQGNRAARKHILQSLNLSGMLARAGCCLPISCSSRSRRPIVCYFSPKQTRPTRFPFIYFFCKRKQPLLFSPSPFSIFLRGGYFQKKRLLFWKRAPTFVESVSYSFSPMVFLTLFFA